MGINLKQVDNHNKKTEHIFYYTPGGVANVNTYTDWDKLVEAHDAVEGGKVIYFDDSNAPIDIVIDGTDFGKTEWTAAHVVPNIVVTTKIADGSTISNWPWKISGPIVVEGYQTAPLTTISSGFHAILNADGANLINKSATSVMMDITGGTFFVASQGMASINLNDASTYEIFGLSTGGTLDVEFKGYANGNNIVRGTDGTYKFCERVGRYEVFPTNANFSGTTANTYSVEAGAILNTSNVLGANVKEALNNLKFAATENLRIKGSIRGTVSSDRFLDGIDGNSFGNTPELTEWTGKLIRISVASDGASTYDASVYKNGTLLRTVNVAASDSFISGALTDTVASGDKITLKIENITTSVDNVKMTATFKED